MATTRASQPWELGGMPVKPKIAAGFQDVLSGHTDFGAHPEDIMAALQSGTLGGAGGDASQASSDAMYQPIKDLTEGRANELRNDPVNAEVMNYLRSIMGGNNQPYNDTTMNSLKAQFGKGTASAEEAQMQQLRESLGAGGGSIYDPSYQAAGREQESQRQGRNLDYAGQLGAQANLANFDARANAAGQMGAMNASNNAQISNLGLAGAGFQAQRFQEQPSTGMPTTLMPQYAPQAQAPQPKPAGQAGQTSTMKAPTAQKAATQSFGPQYDQIPDYLKAIMQQGGTARWA